MSLIVCDTHSLFWFLNDDARLSQKASAAMDEAEATGTIYVPTIVIIEMRYLTEKNRISLAAYRTALQTLRNPVTALEIVSLDLEIADALERIPRAVVPDMPDRIIAATAQYLGLPLVTADRQIRASGINTIW